MSKMATQQIVDMVSPCVTPRSQLKAESSCRSKCEDGASGFRRSSVESVSRRLLMYGDKKNVRPSSSKEVLRDRMQM